MKVNKRTRAKNRSGAALLLLVTMVLLVVVGTTRTLVQSEIGSRRVEVDRIRLRSLDAAINAAGQAALEPGKPIRLPLESTSDADDSPGRYIEVSINPSNSHLTATWVENNQVVDQVRRKIEVNAEQSE